MYKCTKITILWNSSLSQILLFGEKLRHYWLKLQLLQTGGNCKQAEYDLEVIKLEKNQIAYLQAVARARATPSWTFNAESTQSDKLAPRIPVTTAAVAASASSPVCHHQMLLNSGRNLLTIHFGEVEWWMHGWSSLNLLLNWWAVARYWHHGCRDDLGHWFICIGATGWDSAGPN